MAFEDLMCSAKHSSQLIIIIILQLKLIIYGLITNVQRQKLPLLAFEVCCLLFILGLCQGWLYQAGNGGSTSGHTGVVSPAPDVPEMPGLASLHGLLHLVYRGCIEAARSPAPAPAHRSNINQQMYRASPALMAQWRSQSQLRLRWLCLEAAREAASTDTS